MILTIEELKLELSSKTAMAQFIKLLSGLGPLFILTGFMNPRKISGLTSLPYFSMILVDWILMHSG